MLNRTGLLVRNFHLTFEHTVNDSPTAASEADRLLRFRLIWEELQEYGRAIGLSHLQMSEPEFNEMVRGVTAGFSIDPTAPIDLVEAADALGDLDYVVQGSNIVHGFPAMEVIEEIHAANMSKADENGRPIKDAGGKIVKGPNYRKPRVDLVLRENGWSGE